MKRVEAVRALAERIAARLFLSRMTNRQVDRLVLTDDNPHRDHGGWCEKAAADQIEELLKAAKPRRKTR